MLHVTKFLFQQRLLYCLQLSTLDQSRLKCIGGVLVSLLAVDRDCESVSGQTIDYKLGTRICCFSAKHATLRCNGKD